MDEGSKPCITEESIPHLQDHVYIDLEKGFLKKRQFQNEGRDFLSNRTRQSLLIPPLLMAREGWRRDMYVNN